MRPGSLVLRSRAFATLSITALTVSALAVLHGWLTRAPASLVNHGLAFQRLNGGSGRLLVSELAATDTASQLLAAVGRGDISGFGGSAPSLQDAPLALLGGPHRYTRWPTSGTALYGATPRAGAAGLGVQLDTAPQDEATLLAVQVRGTRIGDISWAERAPAWRITSQPVTTRGPATLVAFWWGDAGVRHRKRVIPGNGFRLLDGVLESGALVQAASAVRRVERAGTYDVTWTAWPKQGGQLWLVAVE